MEKCTDSIETNLSCEGVVALKRAVRFVLRTQCASRPFTPNSTSQLDVLGHDGNPLGVDGAQICVFEEADEVGFAGFLQCHDGRTLESQFRFEILCNFAHKSLERQLSDE